MTQNPAILVLNAGSSSLKFALFAGGEARWRGEIAGAGTADQVGAQVEALVVRAGGAGALAGVGHRLVHGGPDHGAPERVGPELMMALEALVPMDPLHMPFGLAAIRAVGMVAPDVAQVVCFDTAFHATMPRVAREFALPRALSEAGVRRYGFHGLSCEYIAGVLAAQAPGLAAGRVIVAHLGAGASLCALAAGRSVGSSFGMSVLDGLMMATRCGALDPGVVFYLARMGHDLGVIEDMLYRRSGLLGVSGISGDVRVLLASDDPRAAEALDLYTYRIAVEMGAMASALDGVDGIVFTAGVGAHSAQIRARVCARLGWMGVALDDAANAAGAGRIGGAGGAVDLRVIPTDEEAMIARHGAAVLSPAL